MALFADPYSLLPPEPVFLVHWQIKPHSVVLQTCLSLIVTYDIVPTSQSYYSFGVQRNVAKFCICFNVPSASTEAREAFAKKAHMPETS